MAHPPSRPPSYQPPLGLTSEPLASHPDFCLRWGGKSPFYTSARSCTATHPPLGATHGFERCTRCCVARNHDINYHILGGERVALLLPLKVTRFSITLVVQHPTYRQNALSSKLGLGTTKNCQQLSAHASGTARRSITLPIVSLRRDKRDGNHRIQLFKCRPFARALHVFHSG